MIHFNIDRSGKPDDEEIGSLYAIYGKDDEENEHFLIIGKSMNDIIFVADISDENFPVRECNKRSSALEITEYWGLTSKIRFFYAPEDFDLTVKF